MYKRRRPSKTRWFKSDFGSLAIGSVFHAFNGASTSMLKDKEDEACGIDGSMRSKWKDADPVWVPMHVKIVYKG